MPFYFANPWGLLGLLSLPAIAAIHMFHHRYPPLLISGAHLWGAEMQVTTAGRKRERLPITTSLILELLAALLIALVLANPVFGDTGRVEHLIVILDNSASMQAQPPGEPSFRKSALAQLEARVEQLDRNAVITLMTTGRRIQKIVGPVSWPAARAALVDWQPSETVHDMQPAWDRAAQLSAGNGQILFLTDHIPEKGFTPPDEMEIISVGRKCQNIGFTTARWIFDSESGTGQIFLRLANYGSERAEILLTGSTGTQELFQRKTSLSAKSTAPIEIPIPGGVGEIFVVLASEKDSLAFDNSVTLIEPRVRTVKVANQLAPEHSAQSAVEKILTALPDVEVTTGSSPHLTIGPAAELPPSSSSLWWLGMGPFSTADADQEQARDLLGPFLLEKQHPLLNGVVLGGVVWGGVQKWPYDVVPIISAGTTPLMGRLTGTLTTGFALNIDLSRSNIMQSPDWPILMMNIIEERRSALPGLQRWNYRLNEDVQFRLYEGLSDPAGESPPELVLESAGGKKPLLRSEVVFISAPDAPGVYTIKDGEREFGRFAVNFFDPRESNLSDLTPGQLSPKVKPVQLFALDDPLSWLILLGSVLILATILSDWFVLKPKGS